MLEYWNVGEKLEKKFDHYSIIPLFQLEMWDDDIER
jgi:hypothetical protein